jgi:hypothetical protein
MRNRRWKDALLSKTKLIEGNWSGNRSTTKRKNNNRNIMFQRLFSSQKRSTFVHAARMCVRTRGKSFKKKKTMTSLVLLVLNNLLRWVGISFCNTVKVFTHSMGSARVFRAYRVRPLPSLSQLIRLSYRQTHNPWLNTEGVGM